jgi:hypothetical protein
MAIADGDWRVGELASGALWGAISSISFNTQFETNLDPYKHILVKRRYL